MRTQEQDAAGVRTVQGAITSAGAVTAGTGFIATRVGTGVFQIRPTGLKTLISAVASLNTGFGLFNTQLLGDRIEVDTFNNAGTAYDIGFQFVIRGLAR